MSIETILIILLIADIFLIFMARKVILKPAKKLNKAIKELRNNN